jgi:hypothetical protein
VIGGLISSASGCATPAAYVLDARDRHTAPPVPYVVGVAAPVASETPSKPWAPAAYCTRRQVKRRDFLEQVGRQLARHLEYAGAFRGVVYLPDAPKTPTDLVLRVSVAEFTACDLSVPPRGSTSPADVAVDGAIAGVLGVGLVPGLASGLMSAGIDASIAADYRNARGPRTRFARTSFDDVKLTRGDEDVLWRRTIDGARDLPRFDDSVSFDELAQQSLKDAVGSLVAGLHADLGASPKSWLLPPGRLGVARRSCHLCASASAAAIAGVFPTAQAAAEAIAARPRTDRGYPYLAHTDELGLADGREPGIAVVVGTFADLDRARLWLMRAEGRVGPVELVELLPPDSAPPQLRVITMAASQPVPAHAVAGTTTSTSCWVAPDAVFVVPQQHVDAAPAAYVPVTCNTATAFVPLASTQLEGTVVVDGAALVWEQEVGRRGSDVEIGRWRYAAGKRGERLGPRFANARRP